MYLFSRIVTLIRAFKRAFSLSQLFIDLFVLVGVMLDPVSDVVLMAFLHLPVVRHIGINLFPPSPTLRESPLQKVADRPVVVGHVLLPLGHQAGLRFQIRARYGLAKLAIDRKSTRLNSSHVK